MNAPQCTPRNPLAQRVGAVSRRSRVLQQYPTLRLLKLCVAFDKLFRAAAGEAHGEAAVFVVSLHPHYRSDAEARMTNFAPQHGVGIAAALCSGAPERRLSCLAARSCLYLLRFAANPAQEFFRRIRILRIGLIAPLLANFRQ